MTQQMEQKDNIDLQQLKDKDAQIDMETTSNGSILKQLHAQYEEINKYEDNAAKRDAANFGIS